MPGKLLESIKAGKSVMFIGAHPDDETLISPLLLFAKDIGRTKVVHFTRGKSGYNLTGPEMDFDLAEVRSREIARAAEMLGFEYDFLGFFNGLPYPPGTTGNNEEEGRARWKATGSDKETPEEALARWEKQTYSPDFLCIEAIEKWHPDIVITFDTERGYTHHREHRAVGIVVDRIFRNGTWSSDWRPEQLWLVVKGDQYPDKEKELITPADLCPDNPEDFADRALTAMEQHKCQFGADLRNDHPDQLKFMMGCINEMHFLPVEI